MTLVRRLATYRPKIAILWPAVNHFHHRFVTWVRSQNSGSGIRLCGLGDRPGLVAGDRASSKTGDQNDKTQKAFHEQISYVNADQDRYQAVVPWQLQRR
jgi:hypothetical protein